MELRLPEHTDAEEFFALVDKNRAYLRSWLPWLDFNTEVAHTAKFINDVLNGYAEGRQICRLMIHDEKIIGICSLFNINRKLAKATLGYWLGADYQGQGLMTAAVSQTLDEAFAEHELELCDLRAATGNTKSRAIAERLGFQYDGVLKRAEWLYDHTVDHAVYSISKAQWYERTQN